MADDEKRIVADTSARPASVLHSLFIQTGHFISPHAFLLSATHPFHRITREAGRSIRFVSFLRGGISCRSTAECYGSKCSIKYPNETDNVALANNYRSIHAVSDAAWDDKHPAGESLDDILQLGSYTFHEYIESGYKIGYEWGEDPYLYYTAEYPHKKPLDQLTEDDLRIIKYAYDRPLLHIYFLSTPTIDKEHTITLTMTTTDGKVQTASVKCKPVKNIDY